MNFRKISTTLFLGATLSFSMACGIGDAIDDVQSDIEKTAAEAKKQVRAKEGFEAAVSGVTGAVLEAALSAYADTSSTAPAFSPYASETTSGAATLDTSGTVNGGTLTTKGELTWTATTVTDDAPPYALTSVSAELKLIVAAAWSNMTLDVEGKKEQSTGNMDLTATITFSQSGEEGAEPVIGGTITQKGKFTLGADSMDVNIVITLSADGGSYTGTINNNPVSGTFKNADEAAAAQ